MITIRINPPADCTSVELDEFESLVRDGGEVMKAGLRERVIAASHLLFLYDSSSALGGISALKRPDASYRAKVFQRAQASSSAASYAVELGWVFVPLSHRGHHLSRPLIEQLLPYAAGSLVYATTRADNDPMQRTLFRYGFHQDGIAYRSSRGDYDLVLYIQRAQ